MQTQNIPSVFQFQSNEVRIILIENAPWFVAADVCKVLDIGNVTMALRKLDADEQALNTIEGLSRGNDEANIINESGLYALILKSRKPEARKFRKWVTSEVLPSIRKTGQYLATPNEVANPAPWVAKKQEFMEMLFTFEELSPDWCRYAQSRLIDEAIKLYSRRLETLL